MATELAQQFRSCGLEQRGSKAAGHGSGCRDGIAAAVELGILAAQTLKIRNGLS